MYWLVAYKWWLNTILEVIDPKKENICCDNRITRPWFSHNTFKFRQRFVGDGS